jgi:hypothetical protein
LSTGESGFGIAEQVAEKLGRGGILASAAKAAVENRLPIAALEALRHPKSVISLAFSTSCKAVPSQQN